MDRGLRAGGGSGLSRVAESVRHRGWRSRLGDFSPGGIHALAFVVVPNLPYALLLTEYALRPRTPFILLYWCIGVIAPKCPAWLVACALAAVAILDLVWFVSGLLMFKPSLVVEAFRYAPLIYPAASSLYLAIGTGVIATIIVPVYLVWHPQRARLLRRRGVAATLMVALVVADLLVTIDPAPPSPAFDSAMRQTDLERSDAMQNHGALLIVMVESLGVFSEPAHTARLNKAMRSDKVIAKYRVREGVSPQAGMTTGATSRELCGRWATWGDYLAGTAADCLPSRLAVRGYEAHAVHAYTGHMFDRFDWYPKLGFEHLTFEEQMRAGGVGGHCGTMFPSACDRAAADIVRELMIAPSDVPRFVYWLTVDSHMPIDPADGTTRWDCGAGGPFGNETVCLFAQIWADVFEATARIATDSALPSGTSVLIVGDHPPSFVSRTVKRYFVPGVVPWIYLEPMNPGTN